MREGGGVAASHGGRGVVGGKSLRKNEIYYQSESEQGIARAIRT